MLICELLRWVIQKLSIEATIDNKILHSSIHSSQFIEQKRLPIGKAGTQGMLRNEDINNIKCAPTKSQIAECLTKNGVDYKKPLRTKKIFLDFIT